MKRSSARWILFALLAVGCECSEREAARTPPLELRAVQIGGAPALTDMDTARWVDSMTGDALAAALARSPEEARSLAPVARVILQGDVLGLLDRVTALNASSDTQARIATGAATWVSSLALAEQPALVSPAGEIPPSIARELPDFSVRASELPSMMHERAFGLRRVFFVAVSRDGATRALYSRLIAIAPSGAPWLTNIVGDLEMLRFASGALVEARVFELDREAATLREVTHAEGVPGVGADSHVAIFDPPAELTSLPCAGCHHDDAMMSLPSAELSITERVASVLAQRQAR